MSNIMKNYLCLSASFLVFAGANILFSGVTSNQTTSFLAASIAYTIATLIIYVFFRNFLRGFMLNSLAIVIPGISFPLNDIYNSPFLEATLIPSALFMIASIPIILWRVYRYSPTDSSGSLAI